MSGIGGNITAILQERKEDDFDDLGEPIIVWREIGTYNGWLDLASGSSPVQTYNAKISESSHYFLTDYDADLAARDPEMCKLMIHGREYEVQWIDDPMGMHEHIEVYLKAVGGVKRGTA